MVVLQQQYIKNVKMNIVRSVVYRLFIKEGAWVITIVELKSSKKRYYNLEVKTEPWLMTIKLENL